MDSSAHPTADQLMRLLDVSRALTATADLTALLRAMAEATTNLLGCERASIWLHDVDADQLWTTVALGSDVIRVPSDRGIVGATFRSAHPVHVPDAYRDERFNPEPDRSTGFVTRDILATPLRDLKGTPLGVIQAINSVGRPFDALDATLLEMLAAQAGVAVQRHRLQLDAERGAALRREMELAREVQDQTLPRELPHFAGFDLAGFGGAASVTTGDCFDLWLRDDGRLGIFLADARGHGIGPTLVVMQARSLVRAMDEHLSPRDVLARVNRRLADDLSFGQFVTAFLAFLSPDGTIDWCSAGHGPILIRPSTEAQWTALKAPCLPLALDRDLHDPPIAPLHLHPTGTLAILSDGFFEARNPATEMFGAPRVTTLLTEHARASAQDQLTLLRTAVRDWQTHDQPRDDQTAIIIKRV